MDFPCVLITSSLEMMLKETVVKGHTTYVDILMGASPGEEGVLLLIDLTVN